MVKVAHSVGVSVKAELGHVGLGEEYDVGNNDALTDPNFAADFYTQTGIDALAIVIGTAHGVYEGKPQIDFDRLIQIKRHVKVPLVLHRGSMTGDWQLKKACKLGISKINIGTDLDIAAIRVLNSLHEKKPGYNFSKKMNLVKEEIKHQIIRYIRVFGSNDKI